MSGLVPGTFVADGFDRRVGVAPGLAMLHYPAGHEYGGDQDGRAWAIQHSCTLRAGIDMVIAPRLQEGHVIERADPLTISPSILCPDCGLHGFVRNGRWEGT